MNAVSETGEWDPEGKDDRETSEANVNSWLEKHSIFIITDEDI